jgi:CDP-glucose 4,6-dehydratase
MTSDFWLNKNVFVTGHTGFKGSWLCLWLQSLGARVTGYALPPPTEPSLFELSDLADGMVSIEGDARDERALADALAASGAKIVIHMAAQPIVRTSYLRPVETFETNVLGTVNLLEAVRRSGGVKALLVVTSDKCYENREWLWGYREQNRLGGDDPYSASKACAELAFAAYAKSYFSPADYASHGVACATARAGNVIGGGDWAKDRLVPDAMRALLGGEMLKIRHPEATRPWQHVLEPLNGYLTLAERLYADGPAFGGSWNFGPAEASEKTVGWVVDKIHKMWGAEDAWTRDGEPHPHENTFLKLDSSKARTLLGWRPALELNEALGWIVEWYEAYRDGAEMREVTLGQIQAFAALNPGATTPKESEKQLAG